MNCSILQKINNLSLYITIPVLLFLRNITPMCILLFGITTIILFFIRKDSFKGINIYYLGVVFLYFLYAISLMYSDNVSKAFSSLEQKMILFFMPLLMIMAKVTEKDLIRIYKILIISCFLISLKMLFVASYNSISFQNNVLHFESAVTSELEGTSFLYLLEIGYSYFSSMFFTESSNIQTSYLAYYVVFSISILTTRLMKKTPPKYKLLYIALIAFFSLIVILISSRAGILTLIVIFLLFCIHLWSRMLNILIKLLIIIGILGLSFFSMKHTRLSKLLKPDIEEIKQSNPRYTIWVSSFRLIKKNNLFGVGIGDIETELQAEYTKNGHEAYAETHMNCHNQFIETYLTIGILGFILLILILLLPFLTAIKQKNYATIFFLIITVINFSFESMLNKMNGVIFFAFFYCLLIYSLKLERKKLILQHVTLFY